MRIFIIMLKQRVVCTACMSIRYAAIAGVSIALTEISIITLLLFLASAAIFLNYKTLKTQDQKTYQVEVYGLIMISSLFALLVPTAISITAIILLGAFSAFKFWRKNND